MRIAIELISNKLKTIGDLVSSKRLDKIVVISKSGEIIGRVKEVRLKKFSFEGIVVKSSFFGSVFIDRSFIKEFNQNEVLLTINPVTILGGLSVYDKSGRKLGKVRKVLREGNKNKLKSLVVRDKFYSRSILIPKDKIDIMKKNIVLNIDYLEYSNNIKKKFQKEKKRK